MLIRRKPKKKFKWLASGMFIAAGLAMVVFLGVALGKETYRKYQIQKEIDSLQQEAEEVDEKNQGLKRLIEYCQTDAYKELEARKKLGLQKEGEKVVIIKPTPENYLQGIESKNSAEDQEVGNLGKWWGYFFRE